jgi:hypothetical protein
MVKVTTNVTRDIVALIDRCAYFKEAKDGAEKEYKKSKTRLESMCAEHMITEFSTDNIEMKITESRRFKAYSDDKIVLDMIPLQHRADCTSLNKKKIDGLIKKGILSNSIKDEEKFTRITTTKFTAVE